MPNGGTEIFMKRKLFHLIIILIIIILIVVSDKAIEYARDALSLCAEVIIPSLFPFFVCSGLLIYSGFSETLAGLLRPVMRPLFNVNENGAAAFVLGIISGYPLGAVTACQLYDSGYLSKSETERLLTFCNNSGPLFIIGSVGVSIYMSLSLGLLLYLAHILSAVAVGVIFRFYHADKHHAPMRRTASPERGIGEIFSLVISNSIRSMLTVCAAVVFSSCVSRCVLSLIPSLGAAADSIICGLFEFVTGICAASRIDMPLFYRLVITAFICGFAGFSVHMQVMGVCAGRGLNLSLYIFGKLLHGILAAGFTLLLLTLIPLTSKALSPSAAVGGGFAACAVMASVFTAVILALALLIRIFSRKT